MYKLINWVKREEYNDWEGAIIEDIKTGDRYITTGVKKWEARPERVGKLTIVDNINQELFFERLKKYYPYLNIVACTTQNS